jgi:guanine deaminase
MQVDTHCHAPQYVFTGSGMGLPLMQWLETYTFPVEAEFKDEKYARDVYEKSVKRHLSYGSTTCSYFATIHLKAALILADIVQEQGQRAFIGKVSMDRNSPDILIEETETGCKEVEEFVRGVLQVRKPLSIVNL